MMKKFHGGKEKKSFVPSGKKSDCATMDGREDTAVEKKTGNH